MIEAALSLDPALTCASSKVATAGGAIGGRAGTGGHYLCSSIGWRLATSFRRRELYTSIKDSQRLFPKDLSAS